MVEIEHSNLVARLKKPGDAIQVVLTGQDCDLIHMGMLLATEACELLDAIKAHTIYRKPLDRQNIVEELGDVEFALEGIRQILTINRDLILQANIDKLSKRYATAAYSDQQARDRADKQ